MTNSPLLQDVLRNLSDQIEAIAFELYYANEITDVSKITELADKLEALKLQANQVANVLYYS